MNYLHWEKGDKRMKRQFITVTEACQILGVSRPTFYTMLKNREIVAIKIGGTLRVNIDRFEKTFGVKVEVQD